MTEGGVLTTEEIRTGKMNANELCMDDLCISKDQFRALLQSAGITGATQNSTPVTTGTSTEPTTPQDTTPPTITLNGNNPANITIGSSYSDMGAVITDNKDTNLGFTTSVFNSDGAKLFNDINTNSLDTSTTTTYTIEYYAIDSSGNSAATTTRTVNIVPME